jgi:4,5-DOPA dioxygenase extradiol
VSRLPTLFVSHGAPTFATEPGPAGRALATLGRLLPHPEAVLVVSPHWQTPAPTVTTAARPATIHDFAGFDPALYRLTYPAPGHPALAATAVERLREAGWDARTDPERGLDHGAWTPLLHLYPEADVPVFQVSLPVGLDGESAVALGRALAPLADEGVLIMGSGGVTHNLGDFMDRTADTGYVAEFAAWVRRTVAAGDAATLNRALELGPQANRAHPSPEHFWPLVIAAGAAPALQPVTVIEGGIQHRILAMDAFVFGEDLGDALWEGES